MSLQGIGRRLGFASRARRGRRLAPAIACALLVAGLVESTGCEDAYEPPCRRVTTSALVTDPRIGARPLLAVARSRGRAIASWFSREVVDAGADGGASGLPAFTALEVAVVDERGALALHTSVPAPEALRARLGGVAAVGVVVEDSAFFVYWIETTATSEPDGRIRTDAALKAAYVRDGVASPTFAPARAVCVACTLTVAPATLGSETIVFARIDPDVTRRTLAADAAPTIVALHFREGEAATEVPVPWLVPSAPVPSSDGGLAGLSGGAESRSAAAGGDLSAYVDADARVVIVAGGRAWLADEALGLVAGPIALPSAPDARVTWDDRGAASVAWSVSPLADGRSTAEVPREIFTGFVAPGASSVASRERASRGRATLDVDRRGEEVGVIFESAGRTIFAAVDPAGRKRGGDVIVERRSTGAPHEYGTLTVPSAHALFARGGGRFHVVSLGGGALDVSEIVCAP
ncbi:MAG: hypothetical protein KF764_26905 [Labilithrix sp.]|nr:hypothetical protein [Labilithrix sp.]